MSVRARVITEQSATPVEPSSEADPLPPAAPAQEESWRAKIKRIFKEYGGVAIFLYVCLSASSLALCYTIVSM